MQTKEALKIIRRFAVQAFKNDLAGQLDYRPKNVKQGPSSGRLRAQHVMIVTPSRAVTSSRLFRMHSTGDWQLLRTRNGFRP